MRLSSRTVSVGVLCAVDFLLFWILWSVLDREAALKWGISLAALAGAAAWALRGRPKPIFALTLSLVLVCAGILTFEAILHLAPGVLRGKVANEAYSRYHDGRGGMYEPDPALGYRLKPDFSCRTYWAGHWWRHETNADGCRGPRVERARAVFLGDSMIYGHGVETDQTAAARFARLHDLPTANLGQQGTCPPQMLIVFEEKGAALRPDVVYLCWHPNDASDARAWYSDEELRRFLASDPERPCDVAVKAEHRTVAWWDFNRQWRDRLSMPLRTTGALRALGREAPKAAARLAGGKPLFPSGPVWPGVPYELDAKYRLPEADQLGWEVNLAATARLAERCRRIGAELVVFDIAVPVPFSEMVEQEMRALGIRYSDAGRVALRRALSGEEIYLKDDGHWTARGNQVVAEALPVLVKTPTSENRPARLQSAEAASESKSRSTR